MATPLISIPTLEQTRSRIRAAIVSRSAGNLRPEVPNTQIGVEAEVMALEIHGLYLTAQRAVQAAFFSTASGDALTSLASQFGVHRKAGTGSTGILRVTITNPSSTVGSSSRNFTFQDNDGNQYFARGTFQVSGGTTFDIAAESAAVGPDTNLSAGTQFSVVPANAEAIAGTTITGAVAHTAFTGGSGVETDEQLRSRFSNVIVNPRAGGTSAEWKSWTLEVEGVTNAFIRSDEPGQVVVYPYLRGNQNGLPTDENIGAINTHLQQYRPVTVELRVAKFTPKVVDVNVQISPFNTTNVEATQRAIREVGVAFGELGQGINLYRLIEAVSTLGFSRTNITSPVADIGAGTFDVISFNPVVTAFSS